MGQPSKTDSHNGAAAHKPVRVRKRRHRQPSLDAEIRVAAKQIMQTQMAEAYKAAALGIVARKLDEVRAILSAAGIASPGTGVVVPFPQTRPQPAPVEHPCFQCGQAGIRRSKPNKWDPVGRWACAVHVPLLAADIADDQNDDILMGRQKGVPMRPKPTVVVTHAQPEPQPEAEIQPTASGPVEAGVSMEEAFANLGMGDGQ